MNPNHTVWRKESKSAENGGDCVELASVSNVIAIRDSKNPNGPKLTLNHTDFRHLAETLKHL
ncbi:DUF397 domain-containing protein [Actinomadura sp. 3N508]|uniref:DUF397 domain-containing protein n=1 Tax=Actinomadura sp. 3N508 TaxID=3375153 RepID=UPI003794BA4A